MVKTNLKLFTSKREVAIFIFIAFCAMLAQIVYSYKTYKEFVSSPYQIVNGTVSGISFKHTKNGTPFEILYIKSANGTFGIFSYQENKNLLFHDVQVAITTNKIGFAQWLDKSFVDGFNIKDLGKSNSLIINQFLYKQIASQHEQYDIVKDLYLSIYLNMPTDEGLQAKIIDYDLSAILALSGLNVMLLWGFLWLVLSPIYTFFQSRYFPYRSKSLDIGMVILAFLLFYLAITNFPPSFARAIAMSGFAFYFIQRGFNVLSFETLIFAVVFLLAISPSFIISIGFWLSVIAVWLIFVFDNALKELKPKWLYFVLFSVWMWLTMMPIVHLIMPIYTSAQLASPIYNIIFDYFYPFSIALHTIGIGGILDGILNDWLSLPLSTNHEIHTPMWFAIVYVIAVAFAAKFKIAFYALASMAVLFFVMSAFVSI